MDVVQAEKDELKIDEKSKEEEPGKIEEQEKEDQKDEVNNVEQQNVQVDAVQQPNEEEEKKKREEERKKQLIKKYELRNQILFDLETAGARTNGLRIEIQKNLNNTGKLGKEKDDTNYTAMKEGLNKLDYKLDEEFSRENTETQWAELKQIYAEISTSAEMYIKTHKTAFTGRGRERRRQARALMNLCMDELKILSKQISKHAFSFPKGTTWKEILAYPIKDTDSLDPYDEYDEIEENGGKEQAVKRLIANKNVDQTADRIQLLTGNEIMTSVQFVTMWGKSVTDLPDKLGELNRLLNQYHSSRQPGQQESKAGKDALTEIKKLVDSYVGQGAASPDLKDTRLTMALSMLKRQYDKKLESVKQSNEEQNEPEEQNESKEEKFTVLKNNEMRQDIVNMLDAVVKAGRGADSPAFNAMIDGASQLSKELDGTITKENMKDGWKKLVDIYSRITTAAEYFVQNKTTSLTYNERVQRRHVRALLNLCKSDLQILQTVIQKPDAIAENTTWKQMLERQPGELKDQKQTVEELIEDKDVDGTVKSIRSLTGRAILTKEQFDLLSGRKVDDLLGSLNNLGADLEDYYDYLAQDETGGVRETKQSWMILANISKSISNYAKEADQNAKDGNAASDMVDGDLWKVLNLLKRQCDLKLEEPEPVEEPKKEEPKPEEAKPEEEPKKEEPKPEDEPKKDNESEPANQQEGGEKESEPVNQQEGGEKESEPVNQQEGGENESASVNQQNSGQKEEKNDNAEEEKQEEQEKQEEAPEVRNNAMRRDILNVLMSTGKIKGGENDPIYNAMIKGVTDLNDLLKKNIVRESLNEDWEKLRRTYSLIATAAREYVKTHSTAITHSGRVRRRHARAMLNLCAEDLQNLRVAVSRPDRLEENTPWNKIFEDTTLMNSSKELSVERLIANKNVDVTAMMIRAMTGFSILTREEFELLWGKSMDRLPGKVKGLETLLDTYYEQGIPGTNGMMDTEDSMETLKQIVKTTQDYQDLVRSRSRSSVENLSASEELGDSKLLRVLSILENQCSGKLRVMQQTVPDKEPTEIQSAENTEKKVSEPIVQAVSEQNVEAKEKNKDESENPFNDYSYLTKDELTEMNKSGGGFIKKTKCHPMFQPAFLNAIGIQGLNEDFRQKSSDQWQEMVANINAVKGKTISINSPGNFLAIADVRNVPVLITLLEDTESTAPIGVLHNGTVFPKKNLQFTIEGARIGQNGAQKSCVEIFLKAL